MARKSISSLTGISIEKFNKLKKEDLITLIRQMKYYSKKRIENLSKHNLYTPALQGYSGSNINLDTMNIQQLRAEYRREKNFLKSETSTVKGYKKYQSHIIKEMRKSGIKIKRNQFDDFFSAYERLKELDPSVAERGFKYNILKSIESYMNDDYTNDTDDIINEIYHNINKIYEENAKIDDVSDYFELSNTGFFVLDEEEKK